MTAFPSLLFFKRHDADTLAVRELNEKITNDERVDNVLLQIASRMTLARQRTLMGGR